MDLLVTSIRRLIWLVLLSAVGGATYAYWRDRRVVDDLAPAEWPPLTPSPETTPDTAPAATNYTETADAEPTTTKTPAASATSDSDGDDGRTPDTATWVEPLADGACPEGYPIKVNSKSGIFHVPDGRFYERTKPERCYARAEDALADGYRQSKS